MAGCPTLIDAKSLQSTQEITLSVENQSPFFQNKEYVLNYTLDLGTWKAIRNFRRRSKADSRPALLNVFL